MAFALTYGQLTLSQGHAEDLLILYLEYHLHQPK